MDGCKACFLYYVGIATVFIISLSMEGPASSYALIGTVPDTSNRHSLKLAFARIFILRTENSIPNTRVVQSNNMATIPLSTSLI